MRMLTIKIINYGRLNSPTLAQRDSTNAWHRVHIASPPPLHTPKPLIFNQPFHSCHVSHQNIQTTTNDNPMLCSKSIFQITLFSLSIWIKSIHAHFKTSPKLGAVTGTHKRKTPQLSITIANTIFLQPFSSCYLCSIISLVRTIIQKRFYVVFDRGPSNPIRPF